MLEPKGPYVTSSSHTCSPSKSGKTSVTRSMSVRIIKSIDPRPVRGTITPTPTNNRHKDKTLWNTRKMRAPLSLHLHTKHIQVSRFVLRQSLTGWLHIALKLQIQHLLRLICHFIQVRPGPHTRVYFCMSPPKSDPCPLYISKFHLKPEILDHCPRGATSHVGLDTCVTHATFICTDTDTCLNHQRFVYMVM